MDFTVDHPYLTLGVVITALVFCSYVSRRRSGIRSLPLPPGPKGYPIIGSLFDMPTELMWLEFDRWFKTYGMLSSIGWVLPITNRPSVLHRRYGLFQGVGTGLSHTWFCFQNQRYF
jgi:hypothetical protein